MSHLLYELLLSNAARQINEKFVILNQFSFCFSEILLKFEIGSLFSSSKQQEQNTLREIINGISYHMCLANETFILILVLPFLALPKDDR